ncbi:DUF3290 domain-containing protein [Selenomonas timonae]|uniref:DUF3290 domain-containing protein n=1 Tax=Selenomonas timonae TaxID=2754044 RepID=A0A7G7VKQ8_9FIRM|nr:DUF3290 domain-containing protein [Selenomonas timonae]QNH54701.1 DUF3290 domain-containing protein [Selenomonas timonae]
MSFYTYDYITAHSQFNDTLWYVLSFLALAALFVMSVKHLRRRLVTRDRDLIVILFLAVAFLGGVQWNSYNAAQSDHEQTSRMVTFLHSLSEDLNVPVTQIRTNSTYLKQGMLVDVQGAFYAVTFNADFTAFQYERTHLLYRDVKIVDKED